MERLSKPRLKELAGEMLRLERKLHTEGSLSDAEHSDLQKLHGLHGAGLFDSIKEWVWKNIHPLGRMIEYGKKVQAERQARMR